MHSVWGSETVGTSRGGMKRGENKKQNNLFQTMLLRMLGNISWLRIKDFCYFLKQISCFTGVEQLRIKHSLNSLKYFRKFALKLIYK